MLMDKEVYVLGGAAVLSVIEVVSGFYIDYRTSGKTWNDYMKSLDDRWTSFWDSMSMFENRDI